MPMSKTRSNKIMPRPRSRRIIDWGPSFLKAAQEHGYELAAEAWGDRSTPRPDERAFLRYLLETWLERLAEEEGSMLEIPGMTHERLVETLTWVVRCRDRTDGWPD